MVRRLYSLCIQTTARFLMGCDRRFEVEFDRDNSDNPFCAFPSIVVEDLFRTICSFSTELEFSHVFLLLTSNRMTHFHLRNVKIHPQDAEDIFRALQPWGDRLLSISIHVFTSQPRDLYDPDTSRALGDLLLRTTELIILASNIAFKLSLLQHLGYLERLVINFRITENFSRYLLHPVYRDGCIFPEGNDELRALRIVKIPHAVPSLVGDMSQIITKCKEIIEIDYDVLVNFNLIPETDGIKQYKLRKTCLGREIFPARKDDMHAVSLQCPDLSRVDFYPNDHGAITALSKFPKLSFLTLTAKSSDDPSDDPDNSSDNFHFGLRPLLEDDGFGNRLTNLIFHDVVDVDLSIIAACCRNLEELGAFDFTEDVSNAEYPPNSFSKVTSLDLENAKLVPTEEVSVVGILSNAPLLELLTIKRAGNLNDETLDVILQSNTQAFSKIVLINMYYTKLTEEGLHKILRAIVSDGNYDRYRRVQIHSELLNLNNSIGIINSYIRTW